MNSTPLFMLLRNEDSLKYYTKTLGSWIVLLQRLVFVVKLRPAAQINGNFALGGATLPICTQPVPPLLSSLTCDPLHNPSWRPNHFHFTMSYWLHRAPRALEEQKYQTIAPLTGSLFLATTPRAWCSTKITPNVHPPQTTCEHLRSSTGAGGREQHEVQDAVLTSHTEINANISDLEKLISSQPRLLDTKQTYATLGSISCMHRATAWPCNEVVLLPSCCFQAQHAAIFSKTKTTRWRRRPITQSHQPVPEWLENKTHTPTSKQCF